MSQSNVKKIIPLHDRVIIGRIPTQDTSTGGIILPESAKEKPVEGEVLAVGKGKVMENGSLLPLAVKVGDRVLFGKWSGTEINIDGKEMLVMHEKDIIGIVKV